MSISQSEYLSYVSSLILKRIDRVQSLIDTDPKEANNILEEIKGLLSAESAVLNFSLHT